MILVVDSNGVIYPAAQIKWGAGVGIERLNHDVWRLTTLPRVSQAPPLTRRLTVTKQITATSTRTATNAFTNRLTASKNRWLSLTPPGPTVTRDRWTDVTRTVTPHTKHLTSEYTNTIWATSVLTRCLTQVYTRGLTDDRTVTSERTVTKQCTEPPNATAENLCEATNCQWTNGAPTTVKITIDGVSTEGGGICDLLTGEHIQKACFDGTDAGDVFYSAPLDGIGPAGGTDCYLANAPCVSLTYTPLCNLEGPENWVAYCYIDVTAYADDTGNNGVSWTRDVDESLGGDIGECCWHEGPLEHGTTWWGDCDGSESTCSITPLS